MADTVRAHSQRREWTIENVHQLFARTTRRLPPPLQRYATWLIWAMVGLGLITLGYLILHPSAVTQSSPVLFLRQVIR